MQIIKGMHLNKKLNELAEHLQGPAYIITENTEYVEDLFLNKYSCLFDIEVLTLKQYIDKILISHKQFARHIYSQADLVFIMRHILSCHTFNTIQFSSNSYEMILELISTLKKIHRNNITLDQFFEDTLLNKKCEDLYTINSNITGGYWTIEEMVEDLIDDSLKTPLYIMSDDYPHIASKELFKKIDNYVPVTLLEMTDADEVLNEYEDTIIHHLFDNVDVHNVAEGRVITGGHPMQECMKIACDIKSRIVNEQLQYEDFMIITNQASYSDYLTICFDELNIPATLSQNETCHYNSDYRKMSRSLSECKGHTFKEIIQFLQRQDISASMIKTLDAYKCDDEISTEEFDLFLQCIIPGNRVTNKTGVIVTSLEKGLTATQKHIYLTGINETFLPLEISDKGFLMEEDYKQFNPHPLLLDEQLQAHYKRIIQVLLNPYLSYTFSYSKKNMAANELIPSILMSRLSDLFELEYINPPLNLIKNNLYLNQSRIDEDPINRLIDHYKMTSNQPEFIKDTDKLGRGVSISRLETYNKCPFSYYIKYGLKITEKREDTLQSSELGSLCHYLMEKCLDNETLVDIEAKHYIEENLKEKYDDHPMNQYFINNLIEDMKMTIKIIQKQLKLGDYVPVAKEKEISGQIGDVPFSGIIDRVDEFENYARIVDYKSSSKEIDLNLAMQGFNIQMLVYLDMLCKQENKDRAGMLYFNMKKRILTRDTSYALGDEDVLKEYRMEGYMVDDGSTNSVKGLGSTPELIAPVKIKKSGEYANSAKVISPDELDQIMEYVENHISELYKKIHDGLIPIHPTLTDGAQPGSDFKVYPCTYCPYKSVCLFDVFENENRIISKDMYKKLKEGDENA
jgi:ATP-dependent helicase/nuclease subunit B